MSQPPYPPQGGSDPRGERSGPQDRDPAVGADDPTRQLDYPPSEGQRNATQQFGQPQFGQPQYGPPQYGPPAQPPYGEPHYGAPHYGQPPGQPSYPQYGQPPYPEYREPQYGPPQYGPQYGQAPYGQSPYAPYGQPAHGQPWGPPPKKNRNTVIAVVVGAVLFVAAIGAGLFFLLRAGDPTPEAAAPSTASGPSAPAPSGEGGIPAATVTPDGLGDDPDLDELAQECYQGDMGSCDDLYEQAEIDSLYGLYGGTCAGRQDVVDADTVFCTTAFPED